MILERKVSYTLLFICMLLIAGIFMKNFKFGSSATSEIAYSIITEYYGANAKEIERIITIPIENSISDIPGIKEIQSTSEFSRSRIIITTKTNIDSNTLYTDLKERINRVSIDFPKAVQKTRILSSDTSNRPVFIVSFESELLGLSELGNFVDEDIKPRYQRIKGTGEIEIGGRGIEEVIIDIDHIKAAQYGINSFTVSDTLQSSYIRLPVGQIDDKTLAYPIFYDSKLKTIDDFRNLSIQRESTEAVQLSDIARIYKRFRKVEQISRINGKEKIIVYIYSGGGVNILTLSEKLIQESKSIEASGLTTEIIYNKADTIKKGLQRILVSMAISMVTLFIFIGIFLPEFKSRVILSASIPLTIFLAISSLSFLKIPIDANIISGLIIGSGLIIDNYLVIFDFIRSKNTHSIKPAVSPLISSTLTTIIVFFPLLILNSIASSVQSISLSICMMLGISLFLSFSFLPKPLKQKKHISHDKPLISIERITDIFISIAQKTLKHKNKIALLYIIIIVSIPVMLIFFDKELSTIDNDNVLFVHVELPSGTTIEETDKTILPYIELLRNINGIQMIENNAKRGNGTITITFDPKKITQTELRNEVETITSSSNKAQFFSGINQNTNTYKIQLTITGYDHEILRIKAKEIGKFFTTLTWVKGVIYHFKEKPPAFIFKRNKGKLYHSSIPPTNIANTLRWNIQGPVSLKWIDAGKEKDVRVISQMKKNLSPYDLGSIPIIDNNNSALRMEQIGSFYQNTESDKLYRDNRQNSISFSIETERLGLNDISNKIMKTLSSIKLPAGYGIFPDKTISNAIYNYNIMFMIFLLAVFLIYTVLAIQNESYNRPLLIISAIPFSSFFPLIFMQILKQPITSASIIALIILAGMSVNNYILILNEIDRKSAELNTSNIVIDAIRVRFNPLFLSCGTTIIAAVPVLISVKPFSDFPSSLAIVISLGVFGSFLGTFLFFPSIATFPFSNRK